VPLLSAAQARFPQDFWLNLELGHALSLAHRKDEALGYFRAALALRPQSSVTYCGLGSALRDMGRVDEAIDHYHQAIRLAPNYTLAHIILGHALERKGRQDEAIDHFQQAVSIEPKSAQAHMYLGGALRDKGRLEEAIDHLQQAVSIEPESAFTHLYLGGALRAKGRPDEAIDHFREAVRLDPNMAVAQADLANSLYAAAVAAVRAAAGQGPEKSRPGEPERADKRRQALAWLRANLELTTKLRNDGNLGGGSLAAWHTDPALASVRDPAALAKLPDAERKPWQRLWADVASAVAADPLEQGRLHAAHRDWAQAADCYARSLTRGPTDHGHFWFEYAALSLLSGDRSGYTRACAHLINACRKNGGPRAYHAARACTLAPDVVADASLPGRLAETELQASARQFWSLTEQGALAYRAGRFKQAVPLFEQSLRADPKPGRAVLNWLWLAMANQRLGKAEEARRWLNRAQAWLDQYHDGMPARAEEELGLHFHNWLEAHVLRREAEALLSPR
jgi:tetratricopeptide (TPR) repeat protein